MRPRLDWDKYEGPMRCATGRQPTAQDGRITSPSSVARARSGARHVRLLPSSLALRGFRSLEYGVPLSSFGETILDITSPCGEMKVIGACREMSEPAMARMPLLGGSHHLSLAPPQPPRYRGTQPATRPPCLTLF
ncbi:hypothetical protein BJV74DRAFT_862033 [Russula compacta]|nr:hypothetical protein BJV74DRAFT_862033 [Russula compacta]